MLHMQEQVRQHVREKLRVMKEEENIKMASPVTKNMKLDPKLE